MISSGDLLTAIAIGLLAMPALAAEQVNRDTISTEEGDIELTVLGHGTLMLVFDGKVIHVDPWTRVGDYKELPKADLVLVTHHHGDHLDLEAIQASRKESADVVITESCLEKVPDGKVMHNGDEKTLQGIKLEAVAAYNLVNKRGNGQPYHPKGVGNGYVVTLGDKRIYVAGDTENTPEMKGLKDIDAAFLPMNLPYTMTPEMVADAAKAFKPKIVYPYHMEADKVPELRELLNKVEGVELRVLEGKRR